MKCAPRGLLCGSTCRHIMPVCESPDAKQSALFLRTQGWCNERKVGNLPAGGRLLAVLPSDPPAHLRKLKEVGAFAAGTIELGMHPDLHVKLELHRCERAMHQSSMLIGALFLRLDTATRLASEDGWWSCHAYEHNHCTF